MSKDITVQITVQEYGPELYKINETGSFIRKELCTVIKTVEHVQELDQKIKDLQAKLNSYEIEDSITIKYVQSEPKGYCIKRTPKNADVLNKWANEQCNFKSIHCSDAGYIFSKAIDTTDLPYTLRHNTPRFTEIFTVEDFFEKVGYKPELQRKSLGMYEGVEIYEDTKSWFVDLCSFRIIERILPINTCISYSADNGIYYSKFYLTPKEANARLKEEILKKAEKKTFTFAELEGFDKYDNTPIGYAIKLIEKEFNVIYLPE